MQYVQIALALLPYIVKLIDDLKASGVIKDPSEVKAMLPQLDAVLPDLIASIKTIVAASKKP